MSATHCGLHARRGLRRHDFVTRLAHRPTRVDHSAHSMPDSRVTHRHSDSTDHATIRTRCPRLPTVRQTSTAPCTQPGHPRRSERCAVRPTVERCPTTI
eukprot:332051-Prymnesium_polylepis.1